jgi:hypothetical protein
VWATEAAQEKTNACEATPTTYATKKNTTFTTRSTLAPNQQHKKIRNK